MLDVFSGCGLRRRARARRRATIEVAFPIAADRDVPGAGGRARSRAVDRLAAAVLRAALASRSSARRTGAGSIGGELFRNILRADFRGAAYPVNRGGEPVAGVRGYASLADRARGRRPRRHLPPRRARPRGGGGGARERAYARSASSRRASPRSGAEGAERQERLLALVRAHGARLVGPNCLGIAVSPAAASTRPSARGRCRPGTIAFSSQSGALGLALLEKAAERGLGFSAFVSIGNKADVSSNDLLEYWEDDADTRRRARSTSSRSATRASSGGSRGAWRGESRSWR